MVLSFILKIEQQFFNFMKYYKMVLNICFWFGFGFTKNGFDLFLKKDNLQNGFNFLREMFTQSVKENLALQNGL